MSDLKKPKAQSSLAEKELDKVEAQFKAYDDNIKELTQDRMNAAPKKEEEPQTKLSSKEIEKSKEIYLKPKSSIRSPEKFNEDYREAYNFDKEYVHFIAENKEIIGETITMWTKPYAGVPCEQWEVPVNKPIWGPRYLAEQLKKCNYHRFSMQEKVHSQDNLGGSYYGTMVVDNVIQRLDAIPTSTRKSIFMGANSI